MAMTLQQTASTPAAFNVALLDIAHSRRTIYEHSRMSGENRHRCSVLPVDTFDNASDELEDAYARNMARYFGEASAVARSCSMPVSHLKKALDTALLQLAHSRRSIYEKTRLSGEHRSAHRMLPTDHKAEGADSCSDSMDRSYANAMVNYFVTKSSSRL